MRHKKLTVHPPSTPPSKRPTHGAAPARLTRGTRAYPLTVASFRTWRGLRAPVAWDQTIGTATVAPALKRRASGGIRPRYSGLRVQGTATSPSSTANLRGTTGCPLDRGPRRSREISVGDCTTRPERARRSPGPSPGGCRSGEGRLPQCLVLHAFGGSGGRGGIRTLGGSRLTRSPGVPDQPLLHPSMSAPRPRRLALRARNSPRRASAALSQDGGGGGIRTHGAFQHTAFRVLHLQPLGHPSALGAPTRRPRNARKNPSNSERASSAINPCSTRTRWFSRASSTILYNEPAAPALGSPTA